MKKAMILTMCLLIINCQPVKAETVVKTAWATAYNIDGTTATGKPTKEGVTVAGRREWLGSTMYVWVDDGQGQIKPENFIGCYEVEDTGGQTIQDGNVIDIFIADYDRAVEFGSKKVIIQVVESEG